MDGETVGRHGYEDQEVTGMKKFSSVDQSLVVNIGRGRGRGDDQVVRPLDEALANGVFVHVEQLEDELRVMVDGLEGVIIV